VGQAFRKAIKAGPFGPRLLPPLTPRRNLRPRHQHSVGLRPVLEHDHDRAAPVLPKGAGPLHLRL